MRRAGRVDEVQRAIADVAIEIGVAAVEAGRVFAQPAASPRVIRPRTEVVELAIPVPVAALGVERLFDPAGEAGLRRRASRKIDVLVEDLARRIVVDVLAQGTAVVRNVANRALLVGQLSEDLVADPLAALCCERLVDTSLFAAQSTKLPGQDR